MARWTDKIIERARQAERERLDPEGEARLKAEHRATLREAQRVLDEEPPLPPEEQRFNARRRAEIRAMVELERRRR